MAERLEKRHLADLHALASRLDVPRFRMLRRPELIEAIREQGGGEGEEAGDGEPVAAAEPGERPESREPEEAEAESVSGILDVTGRGHGFLRLQGLEPVEGDVYISASQIRRCELRPGDRVTGPARPPRRGERHRALVHVDEVNGADPGAERSDFDSLEASSPNRRLALEPATEADERSRILLRAADLLCPFAYGQRVLVLAVPRSGRTMLLRAIATALPGAAPEAEAIVVLIDERPEEVTAWKEAAPQAILAVAPAEMEPVRQTRVAELALERARRRAEAGADVVLICDSLSRLAVAADGVGPVKRLFGSGRELAGDDAGSLTVIATALEDGDDEGEALRAVRTTETALIRLDPELAAAGAAPALLAAECHTTAEEELLDTAELEGLRALRSELAGTEPAEAATLLRERIEATASNAELLAGSR